MFNLDKLDRLDRLFVLWAFVFQIVLIIHFAVRKQFLDSYTLKYGWLVYALSIPAVIISVIIWKGEKSWSYWLGGLLFLGFSGFGFWIEYVKQIQWRDPMIKSIGVPYIFLYLATVMFYWWPLANLKRELWMAYSVLFVIATILNVISH